MIFVKAKTWSSWHIARIDGHTVCGRPIPAAALKNQVLHDDWNRCSSCEQMKNAETVRGGLA